MGLRWSELVKTLSPSYDWEKAIQTAMETDESLAQVCLQNLSSFLVIKVDVDRTKGHCTA